MGSPLINRGHHHSQGQWAERGWPWVLRGALPLLMFAVALLLLNGVSFVEREVRQNGSTGRSTRLMLREGMPHEGPAAPAARSAAEAAAGALRSGSDQEDLAVAQPEDKAGEAAPAPAEQPPPPEQQQQEQQQTGSTPTEPAAVEQQPGAATPAEPAAATQPPQQVQENPAPAAAGEGAAKPGGSEAPGQPAQQPGPTAGQQQQASGGTGPAQPGGQQQQQQVGAGPSRAPASQPAAPAEVLPLTTHQCTGNGGLEQRVCVIRNLYASNGTLYYLTGGAPVNASDLVAAGGPFGGSGTSFAMVTTAAELSALFGASTREELKEALLWRDEFGERYGYFSTMLGMLPSILAVLREYRSTAPRKDGQKESIRFLELPPRIPQQHQQQGEAEAPAWLGEGLACLSPAEPARLRSQQLAGRALRISTAVAWGPGEAACPSADSCSVDLSSWHARRRLKSWRETVLTCLGQNPYATAPVDPPSVLLLNRAYHEGPQIENESVLRGELRRMLTPAAQFGVRSPAVATLKEQAKLYSGATVVIQMSSRPFIASWLLLPRRAVVLQLVVRPKPFHEAQLALAQQMEGILQGVNNVTRLTLVNPEAEGAKMRTEEVWPTPLWQSLTGEQKMAVMERSDCGPLPPEARAVCEREWLGPGLNLVLEPRVLKTAVGAALGRAHDRAGLALPGALVPKEEGAPVDLLRL